MNAKALGSTLALLLVLGVAVPSHADLVLIDFEGLSHGLIVDDEFAAMGLTITADNARPGGPDIAVVFDTTRSGTADPDLEGPPWSGGNIPPNEVLGNVLIISENPEDPGNPGHVQDPDDEAHRPAGTVTFAFDYAVSSFGFDLLDVEAPELGLGSVAFFDGGTLVGAFSLANLGITGGDNFANRIAPITALSLGGANFDSVKITLGGSGAIDNLTFERVPEAGTLLLLGVGLLGWVAVSRLHG